MRSSSQSHQKDGSPGRRRTDEINDHKNTCLYIGNIDKRIDGEQLTQIFAKFGTLEYCYLVYEPSSSDRNSKEIKISRGYGFAKYVKIDDLMKAKTQLDGYEINGRKIKVQISKRDKPRESTPGRYLGKKRNTSPIHRHRGRSRSRSSSGSYSHTRRHHQRKQKHSRKRRQRSRQSRDRSRQKDRDRNRDRDRDRQRERERDRDRDRDYHRRKRSISNQRDRRREKQ